MNILDLINSSQQSDGLENGSKIPWDDPDFSRRMLANHLSQENDWASRRKSIIATHIAWVAGHLHQTPSRILDLGCGPGLYTQALAELGHHCVGVDFSPASIEYARQQAAASGKNIEYILSDIRNYHSQQSFDCILITFGEINVFTKPDACKLLQNCADMLTENGFLVLEAHTYDAVRAAGQVISSWRRQTAGLFSDKPHLYLQENSWNALSATALSRYIIIDAASAEVSQYSSFMQGYTVAEYGDIFQPTGICSWVTLDPETWPAGDDFIGKLQTFICSKNANFFLELEEE